MNKRCGRWSWAGLVLAGLVGLGACSDDDDQGGAAGSGAGHGGSASTSAGAGPTNGGSATKPSTGDGGLGGSGGHPTDGTPQDGEDAGAGGSAVEGGAAGVGEAGAAGVAGAGAAGIAGAGAAGAGGNPGSGGEGGALNDAAGLCDGPGAIVPNSVPSCDLTNDEPTCRGCLKTKTCSEWQNCYGDQPRSACGYATKIEEDGQFDCIVSCFADGALGSADPTALLESCASACNNQCESLNSATEELVAAAYQDCTDECFPF